MVEEPEKKNYHYDLTWFSSKKSVKEDRFKLAYAIKIGAIKAKKHEYNFGSDAKEDKKRYVTERLNRFYKTFDHTNKSLQIKGGASKDQL